MFTIVGVGLMCLSEGFSLNRGDLICIMSAFFYSFQMLYTERYAHKHDPIVLGTLQLAFVSVYGFIFAFILEDSIRLPVSAAGWWQLLYLALGCGALGFIFQTSAEKLSPTSHTTLIYASEPVFVALFSFLMLGEQIGVRQMAGIVLVFIGVWITVRPNNKDERLIRDAD
jgi:drug/metabolite transporter (DMT)-like permease